MNINAIRRALEEGYEDRGVFEPEEKFWKAVKEVIDMLEPKNRKMGSRKGLSLHFARERKKRFLK